MNVWNERRDRKVANGSNSGQIRSDQPLFRLVETSHVEMYMINKCGPEECDGKGVPISENQGGQILNPIIWAITACQSRSVSWDTPEHAHRIA